MTNFFRLILILLAPFMLTAQHSLIMQGKSHSFRTKILKTNRTYTIKTLDTIYYDRYLIGVTDTSIKITRSIMTQDSVMHVTEYPNKLANDTTYRMIWRTDTFDICFRDLIYIKKYVFKNRKWLEPFGFIGVGAALGTILIPVSAIAYGPDDAVKAAVPILSVLAICGTAVFIGTRTITYDMQYDWEFIKPNAGSQ